MDIRDLVAEEDLFDPFEEEEEEEELAEEGAEDEEEVLVIGKPLEEKPNLPKIDLRTPQERINDLIKSMPGQKRVLLRLIDYCRSPRTGEEMDARTEELREYNFSVFSPVVFRELLENAGAIEYLEPADPEADDAAVDDAAATDASAAGDGAAAGDAAAVADALPQDGAAAAENAAAGDAAATSAAAADVQPHDAAAADEENVKHETLMSGDEEMQLDYLEIEENEPGLWVATEDGLAVVDAQDDLQQVAELLDKEPRYLDIYHQILDYCTIDGGRSAKELDNLVNDSPLLQAPRRYSGYFIGRLEREGAIEWAGGWVTTDTGKKILATSTEQAAMAAAEA